MINFDNAVKESIKEHNSNWPQIPHHPYRIAIIRGSGSGKTSSLFNLIKEERDLDKIYLYAKDPYEANYHFLINKTESTGLTHFNDSKTLIEYSYNRNDFYKNTEDYNPNKQQKIPIVFDDMNANVVSKKT